MRYLPVFILMLLISAPFSAFASTSKPSCEITVTTPRGEASITKKEKVFLKAGERVTLSWTSDNATKAKDAENDSILLKGTKTFIATDDTDYKYTFNAGSKKATCEADLVIAEGSIDPESLNNADSRPTISGTATGTKTVRIMVNEQDEGHTAFTSKIVRVRNGEWSVRVNKTLDKGTYQVTLYGDKTYELNEFASSSLGVGVASTGSGSSAAVLTASSLPLLTGGSAGPSASVPVAYLKLVNTSAVPASLAGVWLEQYGTAPAQSVIGFTTVDDKAVARTTVGGMEGTNLFKNGRAYVPLNAVLAPGQLRIFTIKAQLSRSAGAYAGSSLMLDVASLDTAAKTGSVFPIRGTTWTLRAY